MRAVTGVKQHQALMRASLGASVSLHGMASLAPTPAAAARVMLPAHSSASAMHAASASCKSQRPLSTLSMHRSQLVMVDAVSSNQRAARCCKHRPCLPPPSSVLQTNSKQSQRLNDLMRTMACAGTSTSRCFLTCKPASCGNRPTISGHGPSSRVCPSPLTSITRTDCERATASFASASSRSLRTSALHGSSQDSVSSDVRQEDGSSEGSEESSSGSEQERAVRGEAGERRVSRELESRLGLVASHEEVFTGDELHFVEVEGWKLALWRYHPPRHVQQRMAHPLLLLSGLATCAIGYDLHPQVSLARYLAGLGFEVWILEMRGAGLSEARRGEEEVGEEGEKEREEKAGESSRRGVGEGAAGAAAVDRQGGEEERRREAMGATDVSTADWLSSTVTQFRQHLGEIAGMDVKRLDALKRTSRVAAIGSEIKDEMNRLEEAAAADVRELMWDLDRLVEEERESEQRQLAVELRTKIKFVQFKWQDEASSFAAVSSLLSRLSQSLEQFEKQQEAPGMVSTVGSLSRMMRQSWQENAPSSLKRVFEVFSSSWSDAQKAQIEDGMMAAVGSRPGSAVRDSEKQTDASSTAADAAASSSSLYSQLIQIQNETRQALSLLGKYDWDFDTYLYSDLPAAMDYIRATSKPKDGKILALGHSMGGILLYARLAALGPDSGFAAAVTVASSLEYGVSDTSLRLLLPLEVPARTLRFPVVPVGVFARALHPYIVRPKFNLGWIARQISADDQMDLDLFRKLMLNNFCTIPVKLLLQLATVFLPGGLRSRSGAVEYKKGLLDCTTPVLALAATQDLVCPPIAVTDTLDSIPKGVAEYVLFGDGDRQYAHYDLLIGKHAREEVFPVISEFLLKHTSPLAREDDGSNNTLPTDHDEKPSLTHVEVTVRG